MRIAENLVLGIDLGIASVGWGIVDPTAGQVIDAGVWTFNAPETDEKKTPKNQIRQQMRSMRRTIRRRRQRMNAIRDLLFSAGFLPNNSKDVIAELGAASKANPWLLRAEALTRPLSPYEMGILLFHVAKHRGFQSNRKGSGGNEDAAEDKKALVAMQGLGERIKTYITFGQALYQDPDLSLRKRNTPNNYGRTPRRDWLRQEVAILFERQRAKGLHALTPELEVRFAELAFTQGALQDQADRVRNCPFELNQQRAAKHAPSFELFRFLSKLLNLRLYMKGVEDWPLSADDIRQLEAKFGLSATFSYKTVRDILDLDPNTRFRAVPKEDEGFDIAARKGDSAKGTRLLRKALGAGYDKMSAQQRDDIMFAIAFHETNDSVGSALAELSLPDAVLDALNAAVATDLFKDVKGAAHVSAKACRNIIGGLRTGAGYYDACKLAGYDPTSPDASPLTQVKKNASGLSPSAIRVELSKLIADVRQPLIGSPTARKAVIEAIKQFVALVNDHPALKGQLPGKVHVELSRDVGRNAEQRNEITSGINKRNAALDKAADKFEECLGFAPRRGTLDLLTYELAQEQGWKCLYTGDAINPKCLFDGTYQIDHILPWSRFGDDSFHNLTLCTARANQAKTNRTPYEWATSGEKGAPDLDVFFASVEACKDMKGLKKRNYCLKDAASVADKFRSRNLNDTRWACKLLLQSLDVFYPGEAYISPFDETKTIRRLFARPGAITAKARKAWALEKLKKDDDGNRLEDDRHHALDAITVAAIDEFTLQHLTRLHQLSEAQGAARPFGRFDAPWPDFQAQVMAVYDSITVARAEDRKVSGQTHMETVRGIDETGKIVFERLTPEKLLDQVKKDAEKSDWKTALEKRFAKPERSQAIINALVAWQDAGRPADNPPLGPTGDKIEKIKVTLPSSKPGVMVRGGAADRGDMARVDVFSKANAKGKKQYFLVPIYPHHVASENSPPNQAIQADTPERDWPIVDDSYLFEFSLYQKSWVEAIRPDGRIEEGYFRGASRSTSALTISPDRTLQKMTPGIGARNLLNLSKYQVTRLGTKHLIAKEQRTWRGEVFTSGKPPE